ncbi:MAG: arylamine N-acetyltransferase [Burkholderiales bacterium]|nr:arylamine N-acetyltransferase [Burkholderiales bacterium]
MPPDFDLDAYLRRIGYGGPRSTTLDTLTAVHRAHVDSIAFENLDPWLGLPVRLDLASVQHKLVARGRGGFCFEQNLLLGHALRALGFTVADLAARVRWNVPADVTRPRTHMLLAVNVAAQRYIVDAGFGGHTLTAPLRLDRRVPQRTPHGPVRLLRQDQQFELQALVPGAPDDWRALYVFDLQPQHASDFEMASWYLCNHPESLFRTTLVAARPLSDGRIALRDHQLTHYPLDGAPRLSMLDSATALRTTLQQAFGLTVDGLDMLQARLEALAAAGRAPAAGG